MSEEETVVVKSKDGEDAQEFTVKINVANQSSILKNLIEEADDDEPILAQNVSGPVLKLVFEFCEHYLEEEMKKIEKPLTYKGDDIVQPWYQAFIERAHKEGKLNDVVRAANYLDIPELLHLSCWKAFETLKGKTPEEVREIMNN